LPDNVTFRIMNLCTEAPKSIPDQSARNTPRLRKDTLQNELGNLQRQIISGGLIIATNKNLAFLFLERRKLLPSSISSQQPIELAQMVVKSSVERPEDLGITATNGDAPHLTSGVNHRILHPVICGKIGSREAGVLKPVRTPLRKESASTPLWRRVLEARRRSWSMAKHMRLVAPIPPGFKKSIDFSLDKL
jgi:hypothetical protein